VNTREVPLPKAALLSTVNAITIGSLIALISSKSGIAMAECCSTVAEFPFTSNVWFLAN
jgi:hypothetical protein